MTCCSAEDCYKAATAYGLCARCRALHSPNGWRLSTHPFYQAWYNMKARCNTPAAKDYKNYGKRGVTYCTEWEDLANFHADRWLGWREGLTLERTDNEKDYSKENCCWATKVKQGQNTRRTRLTPEKAADIRQLYAAGGVTQGELAKRFGVDYRVVGLVVRRVTWK